MKKENEYQDIIDILLDDENTEPIYLFDENANEIAFEQVAVIPYKEKLYCILKPIDHMESVDDNEAIVFAVEDLEDDEPFLVVEHDEATAIAVFEKYYELLEEES